MHIDALRLNYLASELARIDQKIKNAESLLLESLPVEKLHQIVDALVNLREQRRKIEQQQNAVLDSTA